MTTEQLNAYDNQLGWSAAVELLAQLYTVTPEKKRADIISAIDEYCMATGHQWREQSGRLILQRD
ncbi:hypothetical protein A10D4_10631 [Idiomarina xiamenensis 10-D-4]|uniref:Uncharacterized protein n=2 Tax=Idiomarina xiamenensis TaxID=1207041 RepID=K2K4K2_9GAMM|nr:hypothetical protein A10D4_10631 [Idiomarina xiamenensis 10-D-4]